ncbi:hypothetical protein T09_959 [Trichinella sp. T9]|nr:hypothetical protein T09_959 [Trichinella sp. T9]
MPTDTLVSVSPTHIKQNDNKSNMLVDAYITSSAGIRSRALSRTCTIRSLCCKLNMLNMLKQPLHLVICLPLKEQLFLEVLTLISAPLCPNLCSEYSHILYPAFHFFLNNSSVQRIQLKDKKYTLNKRTEFQEGLLLIQASFAVCISKYKFNE